MQCQSNLLHSNSEPHHSITERIATVLFLYLALLCLRQSSQVSSIPLPLITIRIVSSPTQFDSLLIFSVAQQIYSLSLLVSATPILYCSIHRVSVPRPRTTTLFFALTDHVHSTTLLLIAFSMLFCTHLSPCHSLPRPRHSRPFYSNAPHFLSVA